MSPAVADDGAIDFRTQVRPILRRAVFVDSRPAPYGGEVLEFRLVWSDGVGHATVLLD